MGKAASLCYFRYKFYLLKIGFMKTQRLLQLLMILASGFFFQCTSDPIPGPPGADGKDGIDGVDGVDGVDGTASCISCHSNSTREPLLAQFELSVHATGSAWQRGASASCAQCHGEEGFIDYVTFGAVDTAGYAGIVSPMYCSTCHDKHETFDFENDGQDYALRNEGPQTLVLDPTYTIDFEGASNNCVTCHQPRNSYEIPAVNPDGTYLVNTTRFGPHHGPQSTLLEGILGAQIAGSTGYPGVASATHRTGSSCVNCHMSEGATEAEGGHTWVPTEEACITCHTNGVPSEINGYTAGMATLAGLLANVVGQEFERDADNNPVYDANGDLVLTGNQVIGIIVNNSSQRGLFSTEAAQAAWNYMTLYEDNSKGIHNPAYARALLNNSIEALQN